MTDGRKHRYAVATATLALSTLTCGVLSAAPSQADPSIGDVQARVDHLYHQAEKASERSNDVRIRLRLAQSRMTALQLDLDRQRERVDNIRDDVVASVVAQYQGDPLSGAAQVVLADDPEAFLGQLTTISEYSSERSAKVSELAVEVDRLELRQEEMESQVADITRARNQLERERVTIRHKASESKDLLSRLRDEAREERASRSDSRVTSTAAPASGRAAAAVQFAMGQVGDAYSWGAAGPDAYDCSGLTMAAWGAAGVSLPHSSSAQMGYGTPVSTSALQPGDLVFYYSPVSHVGMYIGNGMIVHAANPSVGVRVDPLNLMPLSGAVRPG